MPNYIDYQKSISKELSSIKDRLRNFIDNHHWPEDGRYKEIILADILRKHLPKNVSVGTGFIMGENGLSTQTDIIVYRNDVPVMFQQADFVIVVPESVLGIIEVKSSINDSTALCGAIDKTSQITELIGIDIFAGIFSFEGFEAITNRNIRQSIKESLSRSNGKVNNLCVGPSTFIKYWPERLNTRENDAAHYSFYKIQDLAFGYFISNLVEDVFLNTGGSNLPHTLCRMFYPIEETKEAHKVDEVPCEI